jgi:hypothetical protein
MDTTGPTAAQHHLLDLFHSVMPGVRGVVLSGPAGDPVADDVGLDAAPLAAAALSEHRAAGGVGASTMVRHGDGLYLVVFLSEQQANAWRAPLAC